MDARTPWRLARRLLILAVLAALSVWAWPRLPEAARAPWHMARLSWQDAPVSLPVPVQGVAPRRLADTWGAARAGGRTHQGIDIFAKRGTAVRSVTAGVIADVSERGLGGRQVWVIGPGRERYYYAHLNDWAEGLARGQVVQAGDLLGHVGDSGNAKGTPPHLHWGIYGADGARDPLPLLR